MSSRSPSTRRSISSEDAPVADVPLSDARAQVARRLDALISKRKIEGRKATELALLRAAFDGTGYARDAQSVRKIGALRRAGRRVSAPRTGDLLLFRTAGNTPGLAITRRVRGTVIEAVAITRGAARLIRLDLRRPTVRRASGRIVNTFLRTIRAGDRPRTAYLAGQLLNQVRDVL